jgi:hypothetical protein
LARAYPVMDNALELTRVLAVSDSPRTTSGDGAFAYKSDLLGGSLQVREARRIAGLLLEGADRTVWQQAIEVDNVLQKPTVASALRVARALRQRLERLEPPFWRALRDGDDELATQVAFCAALARDLLLLEFLETTVTDALAGRQAVLPGYSWAEFLEEHARRDPATQLWTQASRRKMGQIAIRILVEVGLLDNTVDLHLQSLFLRPELRQLLQDSGQHRVLSCLQRFAVG